MTAVEQLDLADLPPLEPGLVFEPCEESTDLDPAMRSLVSPTHKAATWLPAAFDKWGVPYRLVTGWETRGRPASSGAFDPRAPLTHHTGARSSASNPHPALRMLIEGRSDLPGPLCQVSTDFNGITSIIAAGRANHAGKAKAVGTIPAGDGNALWIGNEVETDGLQAMPEVQYRAAVLVAAAVLDQLGAVASLAALHATTSYSGKWDLGAGTGRSGTPYSLAKFRADVAATLTAGPPNHQENDMPFDQSDTEDLFTRHRIMVDPDNPASRTNLDLRKTPSYVLEYAAAKAKAADAGVVAVSKAVTALTVKVDALATKLEQLATRAEAPTTVQLDKGQLTAALRELLGSLDGATPTTTSQES